jgi:hypothetical protein
MQKLVEKLLREEYAEITPISKLQAYCKKNNCRIQEYSEKQQKVFKRKFGLFAGGYMYPSMKKGLMIR